jgi:acetolactate synthase-1/2/3 large subunit
VERAAERINRARMPVVLLGMSASTLDVTEAVRLLLRTVPLPVVGTFQASGVISRALLSCFVGRVGLFKNQPGDRLIDAADLILSIGFDPIEYDPVLWNGSGKREIVHVHSEAAEIDRHYLPAVELVGGIPDTLHDLMGLLKKRTPPAAIPLVRGLQKELRSVQSAGAGKTGSPVHPLRLIRDLRGLLDDRATVICDVGSIYMWMARYFFSFEPRRLLFSNGQQTLGVALPWAIAASLVRPGEKIVSMSGDGGFLFSAMELETAVRLKSDFVHLVWRDGAYDMVRIQQAMKYGRESGVVFGMPDIVRFAQSFGAKGFRIDRPEAILPTLKKAMNASGPVLIDVPIDYSDNRSLCEAMEKERGH